MSSSLPSSFLSSCLAFSLARIVSDKEGGLVDMSARDVASGSSDRDAADVEVARDGGRRHLIASCAGANRLAALTPTRRSKRVDARDMTRVL